MQAILLPAALLLLASLAQAAPQRVASLGGPVTEIVHALDAGDRLVVRDSSSLHPPEALKLPDAGYFRSISAEGILALRPDLVLAAHGTGPSAQLDRLRSAGVPVIQTGPTNEPADLLASIRTIGEALHRPAQAEALARRLASQFESLAASTRDLAAPGTVLVMQLGPGSANAAGTGTAADALIRLAGGRNLFQGHSGYRLVSVEALLALDPDVILHAVLPGGASELPAWVARTRAGRAGRVHTIDPGLHLGFGPRLPAAAAEVAAWLHPTAFARKGTPSGSVPEGE